MNTNGGLIRRVKIRKAILSQLYVVLVKTDFENTKSETVILVTVTLTLIRSPNLTLIRSPKRSTHSHFQARFSVHTLVASEI